MTEVGQVAVVRWASCRCDESVPRLRLRKATPVGMLLGVDRCLSDTEASEERFHSSSHSHASPLTLCCFLSLLSVSKFELNALAKRFSLASHSRF